MYRQIAADLRSKIEAGELPRGAQLPTEIELRDQYEASRNTVRDAVKWLITRGLVETRPGQGTFVVEKITPFVSTLTGDPETGFGGGEDDIYALEVKATLREPTASVPRIEIQQVSETTAPELQLGAGSTVVSRHQSRSIDGTPWSLQTSFYPLSLVQRGAVRLIEANDIQQGSVEYLRESIGIKQVGYRDTLTVRPPDTMEARFFGLADDGHIAVIETRRTAFDESGAPFSLTVSIYPADRNEFTLNVGQIPDEFAAPPSDGPASPDPDETVVPDTG